MVSRSRFWRLSRTFISWGLEPRSTHVFQSPGIYTSFVTPDEPRPRAQPENIKVSLRGWRDSSISAMKLNFGNSILTAWTRVDIHLSLSYTCQSMCRYSRELKLFCFCWVQGEINLRAFASIAISQLSHYRSGIKQVHVILRKKKRLYQTIQTVCIRFVKYKIVKTDCIKNNKSYQTSVKKYLNTQDTFLYFKKLLWRKLIWSDDHSANMPVIYILVLYLLGPSILFCGRISAEFLHLTSSEMFVNEVWTKILNNKRAATFGCVSYRLGKVSEEVTQSKFTIKVYTDRSRILACFLCRDSQRVQLFKDSCSPLYDDLWTE